eukprot:15485266-Alexandrium_andersonii.AAC.1
MPGREKTATHLMKSAAQPDMSLRGPLSALDGLEQDATRTFPPLRVEGRHPPPRQHGGGDPH